MQNTNQEQRRFPVPGMLRSVLLVITMLFFSACGSGSNNVGSDAGTDVANGEGGNENVSSDNNNNDTPTPPVTPTTLPTLQINGVLPATINQSFTCNAGKQTRFTLVFDNLGKVQYSDNNGGADTGTYQLDQSGLSLTFTSGVTAVSTNYAVAGDLLVGVSIRDSDSKEHGCIARAHNVGDRLATNVAFMCGRRNVTFESANTFTLYTDGSADWENVFEIIDDTLFQTRIGTYILDIASGSVLMVFKELDADTLQVFSVAVNESDVQVVGAPTEGEGVGVEKQACDYI